MSVHAHRVNKVEYAPETTFDLHDEKLTEFIDGHYNFWGRLNDDCCGQVDVSVETLNQALKQAKELELDEDTVRCIKADIEFAKNQGEDYVTYDLF